MKSTTLTKAALLILIFLLTVDVGSRWLLNSPSVEAGIKVQYKVISTRDIKTGGEYEALLNRMAGQGWVFDHFIEMADLAVFKK